jgi:hypothetical protein
MLRVFRRWPPLVWLLVAIGSLFTIMGGQRADLLIVGQVLVFLALGLAVWLAVEPEPGKPGARPYLPWALGVAAWYIVVAVVATLQLDWRYGVAALAAGAIPATAATLVYATARRKTRVVSDDEYEDESAEDMGAFPGIGLDDRRPLGDTPAAHDEIIPQDIPKDSPARQAAEQQAAEGSGAEQGVTRGHAEGGAAGTGGDAERQRAERLGDREKGGARAPRPRSGNRR